jgi:hypothetical protein
VRIARPKRPDSPRAAVIGAAAVLAAVIGGFAWISIQSYELLHGESQRSSPLEPVKIVGQEEVVFDYSRQACGEQDIPDAPARAFRDADGIVHLWATHYIARQATGRDLGRVEHRCSIVMQSRYDRRPSAFQDKEWLFSPYTIDGRTVFALIHDEYQGYTRPNCIARTNVRCWYNAVTLARSDDLGATFRHARPAPDHLVAEVPYRYERNMPRFGMFQPSSIVQKDGYYYSMVTTTAHRKQEGGTCVMRTKRLDDPTSWRGWDGDGYDVRFVDPYREQVDDADHVCEPVSPGEISDMSLSLTYNTYFGKYLLVAPANQYDARRRLVNGFYYSLSDDLIDWSPRKLIREVVLPDTYRCGDRDPLFYASILDPTSGSRNFETSGRRPYLYFTRMHYRACQQTSDRDLVRVQIEFSK